MRLCGERNLTFQHVPFLDYMTNAVRIANVVKHADIELAVAASVLRIRSLHTLIQSFLTRCFH